MKIYLDVCCLNRPFDGLNQERIRLETEAILSILNRCESGQWELISSDIIVEEINQTPNWDKQKKLKRILEIATLQIPFQQNIEARARILTGIGFKVFDAFHIASAEAGNVSILLTTDDRLLRKAINYSHKLKVTLANPVQWLMKFIQEEGEGEA